MMRTLLLSSIALAAIATAGLVGAASGATSMPSADAPQTPPGAMRHWDGAMGHGMMGGPMGFMGSEARKEADTNHDGTVSRSELQAYLDQQFDAADTNHDGKLSEAEIKAWHEAQKQKREDAAFKRADANGDGGLSKSETVDKALAHFDEMDTNHDGIISADEMKAAQQKFRSQMKGHHGAPPAAPQQGSGQ